MVDAEPLMDGPDLIDDDSVYVDVPIGCTQGIAKAQP